MGTRLNKEQKRSNILNAAATVFSKDGYHQAKVEDIARTAGIGKGTIYLYFENKRHLFHCMMKEVFDIFLDSLYEQIEYKDDLEQILRTIIEYTFNFLDEHREMINLIINRPGTVDEDIQTWISTEKQKIIQFIARVIAEYTTSNGYRRINSAVAAHCFLGALVSLMAERLFGNKDMDAAKISDEILDIFFSGIRYPAVQV